MSGAMVWAFSAVLSAPESFVIDVALMVGQFGFDFGDAASRRKSASLAPAVAVVMNTGNESVGHRGLLGFPGNNPADGGFARFFDALAGAFHRDRFDFRRSQWLGLRVVGFDFSLRF